MNNRLNIQISIIVILTVSILSYFLGIVLKSSQINMSDILLPIIAGIMLASIMIRTEPGIFPIIDYIFTCLLYVVGALVYIILMTPQELIFYFIGIGLAYFIKKLKEHYNFNF